MTFSPITYITKSVSENYVYGWIEINGNPVKGIVADGETSERVIEVLEILYKKKQALDANLPTV